MTLEGRPLRYFLRRGNGLRAFFNHANQAFNRLITFSYTNRNNQRQRLAKKTAIWPKLARSITGRRRGDTPPSRSHPAASGLPSPQGLRPSAALRPHPTMERLRRYGLGEPGASAWRKAVSSRACEGAKPPHTPQPGRRGSTGRAILKHRSSSTAAGFTPRKGVGQLGRWRGKRPSSVNET